MKYSYFFLSIILVLYSWSLLCIVPTTREIIISCECGDNENIYLSLNQPVQKSSTPKGIGAISGTFLTAFYQEAAPILITGQILDNILYHKALFDEFTQKPQPTEDAVIDTLYNKYKTFKRFNTRDLVKTFYKACSYSNTLYDAMLTAIKALPKGKNLTEVLWKNPLFEKKNAPLDMQNLNSPLFTEIAIYLLCSKMPFNRYTIRKITHPSFKQSYAYICVPHSYTKKIINFYSKVPTLHSLKDDIKLGLHVSKYPIFTPTATTHFIPIKHTPQCRQLLISILPELFVTKKELPSGIDQVWGVYAQGHGVYAQESAYLVKKQVADKMKTESEIKKLEKNIAHLKNELSKQKKKALTDPAAAKSVKALEQQIKLIQANITDYKKHITQLIQAITHNRQAHRIAGFTLEEFQKILTFFNKSVTTGFFFYTSCSVGGQLFIDVYKDITTNKLLSLTYAIASDTLTEAYTLSQQPGLSVSWFKDGHTLYKQDNAHLIDYGKNSIKVLTPYNFNAFFTELHQTSPTLTSYKKLFSYVSAFMKNIDKKKGKFAISPTFLSNLPSIRFPGTEWFNVIDFDKRISALTNVRVLAQGQSKLMLNVSQDTIKDVMLLYAPKIPFTITINRPKPTTPFPGMVSMIPGKASHTFEHLEAPAYTFTEVIEKFFPFKDLSSSKLFFIKKLTCINTLPLPDIPLNNVYTFNNVVIINKGKIETSDTSANRVIFTNSSTPVKTYNAQWAARKPLPKDFITLFKPYNNPYNNPSYASKALANFKAESQLSGFTGAIKTSSSTEIIRLQALHTMLQKKQPTIRALQIELLQKKLSKFYNNVTYLRKQYMIKKV